MLRPPTALPPPSGVPAGWYRDPYGYPLLRYYDGRPGPTTPPASSRHLVMTSPPDAAAGRRRRRRRRAHRVADRQPVLARRDWPDEAGPLLVFVAISLVVGYGPSVWWCWYASRRWGSGSSRSRRRTALPLVRCRLGATRLARCLRCELADGARVQLTGIPLVGNTEGIGNVGRRSGLRHRVADDRRRRRAVRRGAGLPRAHAAAAC